MTTPFPWISTRPDPVPKPEELDRWWREEPKAPADPTAWLSALRLTIVTRQVNAAAAIGRAPKVAMYVVGSADEQDRHRQTLASHAEERGWLVRGAHADASTAEATTPQSGFHQACTRAAAGFADGVLTVGRSMITPDNTAYESILRWLDARGTFLAFLPAAVPTPPAWFDRPSPDDRNFR